MKINSNQIMKKKRLLRNYYLLLKMGWGVGIWRELSLFNWLIEVWKIARNITKIQEEYASAN